MPENERSYLTQKWFIRATHDLQDAKSISANSPVSPNTVWLIQQAVEKAIKALLIHYGIVYRRIHDLEELRMALPGHSKFRSSNIELQKITLLGIESRYPEEVDELLETEVQEIIELGERILEMIGSEIPAPDSET